MTLDGGRYALHYGAMDAKINTTVYLTREQRDELKALSEATRVPVAVYIRDGIAMVLAAHAERANDPA